MNTAEIQNKPKTENSKRLDDETQLLRLTSGNLQYRLASSE
jgi:hypothetical protein